MNRKPSPEQIDRLIRTALEEDLGTGDITTRSIISENKIMQAELVAKEPLVLCGIEIAQAVFHKLDPDVVFPGEVARDGDSVASGGVFLRIRGKSIPLLEGERVALNILQRLSGIATLTRRFVDRAKPITVLDTRKTTPGLRVFEKYAVQCGGGTNHRFGLYDAVLIKDNHIKAAGGIADAVARVRDKRGNNETVEVETTSLEEVREALSAKADIIMLDNMAVDMVREAVHLIAGRARTEVSGSITLEKIDELADTGIDSVSVGALTHSVRAVDISLNFTI